MNHRRIRIAFFTLTIAAVGSALGGCESQRSVSVSDDRSSMGVVSRQSMYDYAVGVLEQGASAGHAQLRANAVEGLQHTPELIGPYVRNGLADDNRGVRFVSAMSIGHLRLRELAPLCEPLLLDESESVQAAAIFALRRCGQPVDLNPLARMLRSTDPEVRGNAAMILGELGDRTAAEMLVQAIGQQMELAGPARARIVDMQLAEALVKLGEQQHVQSIRAALFLQAEFEAELTALACMTLGRLRDSGSVSPLRRLIDATGPERRPAEVRMAAAAALAEMGADGSIEPALAVASEYLGSRQLNLRYQAASTLGATRSREALPFLQRLLDDSNPLVQVAAAAAVVRIDRG